MPDFSKDPFWLPRQMMGRNILTAIVAQSSKVDQVSSWALGAAGGAGALVISNLHKATAVLSPQGQWWLLGLLSLSGLAGIVQKIQNTRVSIAGDILEKVLASLSNGKFNQEMIRAFDKQGTPLREVPEAERDNILFNKVLELGRENVKDLAAAMPRWLRGSAERNLEAHDEKLFWGLKKVVGGCYWQAGWTLLQLLLFLAAFGGVLAFMR